MQPELPVLTKQVFNILIVEDLPSWQKNFRRLLKDQPFNVLIPGNYREALQFVHTCTIDVLILDVNLSGVPYNVDGLHLANEIWKFKNDIKIIIVSGSREWDRRLGTYGFNPEFILEKQSLDQYDLISKIYQSISKVAH